MELKAEDGVQEGSRGVGVSCCLGCRAITKHWSREEAALSFDGVRSVEGRHENLHVCLSRSFTHASFPGLKEKKKATYTERTTHPLPSILLVQKRRGKEGGKIRAELANEAFGTRGSGQCYVEGLGAYEHEIHFAEQLLSSCPRTVVSPTTSLFLDP